MKSFYVEAEHDARHRGVWYGPGVLLIVEEGESVEVYAAPKGKRGACIGNWQYNKLDAKSPPPGLKPNGRAG